MNTRQTLIAATLLMAASSASGDSQTLDLRAYARLQNCMAGAELAHNLSTGLDRYCINSYLATVRTSSVSDDPFEHPQHIDD